MCTFLTVLLVVVEIAMAAESSRRHRLDLSRLPSTGQEWISLSKTTEFQPAALFHVGSVAESKKQQQQQQQDNAWSRRTQERFWSVQTDDNDDRSSVTATMYVDSFETLYDAYSQAWRFLGFYIDCAQRDENDDNKRQRRKLNEDNENGESCRRYLLWAAYIDLDYSGGGLGEYQFYDREKQTWNKGACNLLGGERCVKMDCHLPDTHYSLLGYYKEAYYVEWMEQLFKHQGYCVWNENQYSQMQKLYYSWPQGCTQSEVQDENGDYLYFDLKPGKGGYMDVGLYSDNRCSNDYSGSEHSVEEVLLAAEYNNNDNNENNENDDYDSYSMLTDFEQNLKDWNDAMDEFKICHPCKSADLRELLTSANQQESEEEGDPEQQREQPDDGSQDERSLGESNDQENDPNNGYFACNDDAGYYNVNQCMKFRTKTDMEALQFQELMLATQQGSITSVTVGGIHYGHSSGGWRDYHTDENLTFFFASVAVFITGLACLALGIQKRQQWSETDRLKQPLIGVKTSLWKRANRRKGRR